MYANNLFPIPKKLQEQLFRSAAINSYVKKTAYRIIIVIIMNNELNWIWFDVTWM